jgi:hypothetical protein
LSLSTNLPHSDINITQLFHIIIQNIKLSKLNNQPFTQSNDLESMKAGRRSTIDRRGKLDQSRQQNKIVRIDAICTPFIGAVLCRADEVTFRVGWA